MSSCSLDANGTAGANNYPLKVARIPIALYSTPLAPRGSSSRRVLRTRVAITDVKHIIGFAGREKYVVSTEPSAIAIAVSTQLQLFLWRQLTRTCHSSLVAVNNWEGGIRGNSFVSGGFLAPSVRGTVYEGLVTAWDW